MQVNEHAARLHIARQLPLQVHDPLAHCKHIAAMSQLYCCSAGLHAPRLQQRQSDRCMPDNSPELAGHTQQPASTSSSSESHPGLEAGFRTGEGVQAVEGGVQVTLRRRRLRPQHIPPVDLWTTRQQQLVSMLVSRRDKKLYRPIVTKRLDHRLGVKFR